VNTKWWVLILLLLPGLLCSCDRKSDTENASHNSSQSAPLFSFRDKFYAISTDEGQNVRVAGHLGKIFHSSDGAKTWELQETNVREPLFDVDFVDTLHGWAVGNLGLILHTSDGGKTWEKQGSKTDNQFFGVDFVDERVGWVVGYYGSIFHTSDGGQTWEDQSVSEDVAFNDVHFVDQETGWAVGEFSTILHTQDAGKNWERLTGAVEEESLDGKWEGDDSGLGDKTLFGVSFQNRLEGWVAGMDGIIAHTIDGGRSWSVRETGVTKNLYDIELGGDFGIAVGALGAVIITQDGGKAWNELSFDAVRTYSWLTGVAILENSHALITGGHGTMLSIKEEKVSKILGLPRGTE
jgi:photosystem II stability/assembly factor-like uncharacterized protein